MKYEHLINEIKGICILAFGLIVLASLVSFTPDDLPWYTSAPNVPVHNLIRITGAYTAGVLFFVFGLSAYCIAGFMFFWGVSTILNRPLPVSISKLTSLAILMIVVSSLLSLTGTDLSTQRFNRAGIIGLLCSSFLEQYFGVIGAYIILFTLGALALILIGEFLLSPIFIELTRGFNEVVLLGWDRVGALLPNKKGARSAAAFPGLKAKPKPVVKNSKEDTKAEELKRLEMEKMVAATGGQAKRPDAAAAKEEEKPVEKKPLIPNIKIFQPKEKTEDKAPEPPPVVGEYHLPSLDLLNDPPQIAASKIQDNLVEGAKMLEATLADFGVSVRVADIERGPVITRYELEPAPGVKVQSITSLSDDISLAMRAPAIRIVAPIPGKNRVGIEVPNGSSAAVYLKDVLQQSQFRSVGSKLTLALGKDISGNSLIFDLAEMPHLLVAGTTGSGKTVCLNSLIMSILFNASPQEVKFLMVDPKMVELAPYNDMPHLLCPVITDHKKVSAALNWVVTEMENRYRTLAKESVRNIKGYHQKGLQMPYIVVVIDELADLMQVSAKTIESAITRLAQLARAVGIHLILATQRPSVDVITGVIKANFPARISFKVASKVDSRTVLDTNGAQDLLGKGDLLFMKPGDPKPTRGQCSYVSDDEINRVIEFVKKEQVPHYNETVTKAQPAGGAQGGEEQDEMYDEAVRVVVETNQASVSILQRRLRLGYTRAARLIDIMEQNGIVGPYVGSKARDILVDREKWLLDNMTTTPEEPKEQS